MPKSTYTVPVKFRQLENLHISFWLVKDISWCLIWKGLGMAMILPTLSLAIWFTWRNRGIVSELCHNLAIVFWITANSYWMISEFFGFDEMPVWGQFEGKHISLVPFTLGILILVYYYVFKKPVEKGESVVMK